jgi:hypothetical protein
MQSTERRDATGTVVSARAFVDHYCTVCGMFLISTDAPPGKRMRLRCTSKGCKGKLREIVVNDPRAIRR